MSNDIGTNLLIDLIEKRYPREDAWYGVEWDVTVASSVCIRIGRADMHIALPIQSQIKSAVVRDDQTIAYYLDPLDATKRENGAAAILDGTDGQVLAIFPTHYRKFESDGVKRRVKISPYPLKDYVKVQRNATGRYLGSVASNKLLSVSGVMPTTGKTRAQFRSYAAARGAGWSQVYYSAYADIFWLYLIEYADFNSQLKLGDGATNASSTDWAAYNSYYPVLNNGVGNGLGNRSGSIPFTITDWYRGITTGAGSNKCIATGRFSSWNASYVGMTIKNIATNATALIVSKDTNDQISIDADIFTASGQGFVILNSTFTSQAAVYRGIEHIFGQIWSFIDGININYIDDNNRLAYICSSPLFFADNTATNYILAGNISANEGYVKSLIPGHILPESVGGSSSTWMSDYHYKPALNTAGWRVALWFGSLSVGAYAGLLFANCLCSSGDSRASIGSRLNLTFTQNA